MRFAPGLALTVGGSFDKAGTVIRYCDQGSTHSKSEKVCGTVFSVKKNCGKSAQIRASFLGHLGVILGHFGTFWVIIGPCWTIFGHLGSYLGHFGGFWVIFGHF